MTILRFYDPVQATGFRMHKCGWKPTTTWDISNNFMCYPEERVQVSVTIGGRIGIMEFLIRDSTNRTSIGIKTLEAFGGYVAFRSEEIEKEPQETLERKEQEVQEPLIVT